MCNWFSVNKIKSIMSFLWLLFPLVIWGYNISGKVMDVEGKPLGNVVVATSAKAVLTNNNGYFNLRQLAATDTVKFHLIGFEELALIAEKVPYRIQLHRKSVAIEGMQVSEEHVAAVELRAGNKTVIKVPAEGAAYTDAADLLAINGDVQIKGSTLAGEKKTVSILGHQDKHTLVLLDGVPLNMSGKEFDISTIPAAIIDRVEIVKSGAGAITGGGSIGGAINIITRTAEGSSLSKSSKIMVNSDVNQSLGSFDLVKSGLSASLIHPDFQIFASTSRTYARNDFEFELPTGGTTEIKLRENNQKEIYDSSLNVSSTYLVNSSYSLIIQDFEKHLPGPITQIKNFDKAKLTGGVIRHNLSLRKEWDRLSLMGSGYCFDEHSRYDNTKSSGYKPYLSETDYGKKGVLLSGKYQLFNALYNLGMEYKQEGFENCHYKVTFVDNITKVDSLPDVSIEAVMKNLSVNSGVDLKQEYFPFIFKESADIRYDYVIKDRVDSYLNQISLSGSQDHDDYLNWRMESSIEYQNWYSLKLGGSIGTGFTLPSFYDIYWKGDSHASGNPDLKPEVSRGWQTYLRTEYLDNYLQLSYHHDRIEDLIYWIRSLTGWKPENLADAEISNLQLEGELQPIKHIRLGTNLLWTQAVNKTNESQEIINTPESKTTIYLSYEDKHVMAKLSYNRVGQQWSKPDHYRPPLPAYELLNLETRYNLKWKKAECTLMADLNNLLDEPYEIFAKTPRPGFNWKLGLNIKYAI